MTPFDQFWAASPHQYGKGRCRALFHEYARHFGEDEMVEAMKAYHYHELYILETEKKYVVQPIRWLTEGRYEDMDPRTRTKYAIIFWLAALASAVLGFILYRKLPNEA